jgi:hypothetical protein
LATQKRGDLIFLRIPLYRAPRVTRGANFFFIKKPFDNGISDTTVGKNINKVTVASLLIALGIIYGDIGTSPLYVLNAITKGRIIDERLILGSLSCIIWTLTLQTTLKYVVLTLKADNRGEGGIFSLYALVRRQRRWLVIPAMLGGAALLADGMITPPISVTSSIEGLRNIQGLGRIEDNTIVYIVIRIYCYCHHKCIVLSATVRKRFHWKNVRTHHVLLVLDAGYPRGYAPVR